MIPAAAKNSRGVYCLRLHAMTPATAADTSRPPKTTPMMIAHDQVARLGGALLPVPLLGHEHESADAGDFVARDLDLDAQLALRQRRKRRVREGERPVGPRLQLRGTRGHFARLPAAPTSRPNSRASTATARTRAVLSSSVGAGPGLGERVFDAQDLAGLGHEDAPFFGALGDVAFEGRDADVPARLGKIPAEQLPPPLFAGGRRHELVRPAAPIVGDRQHAPCGPSVTPRAATRAARDVGGRVRLTVNMSVRSRSAIASPDAARRG